MKVSVHVSGHYSDISGFYQFFEIHVCVTVRRALLVSPPKTLRSGTSFNRVTQRNALLKKEKLAKENSVLISLVSYYNFFSILNLFL